MNNMNIFFQCLVIFAFVFNAFALNAFAASCPQPVDMGAKQERSMSFDDSIPCPNHKAPEQSQKDRHCDGICLCFDAALHNVPVLPQVEMPKLFFETVLVTPPSEYIWHSRSIVPLYRPPISLS